MKGTNLATRWLFEKSPILGPFLFLLITWLPYLIFCFPGVAEWDGLRQLENFFNLTNSDNTHPLFTTLLMGICMKAGKAFGNDNLGIFLYIFPQFILSAFVFAYSIYFTKRFQSPYWLRWSTLLFFAVIPLWPTYAIILMKDSLFQLAFIGYIIFFIRALMEKENFWKSKSQVIGFTLVTILLELIRSNGIHIVIFSLPILFYVVRKECKKVACIFVIAMAIFGYLGMNKIIVPMMGVAPGRVSEMFNIPFQQTARYVKEYKSEISQEEKEILAKVFDYDKLLKNYDPQFSDYIKMAYNSQATNEDLEKYFKVWIQQFKKHPKIYLQATINNCYGYFYPDKKEYKGGLVSTRHSYNPRVYTGKFKLTMFDEFKPAREAIENLTHVMRQMPGIGMLFSTGFYTWVLLLSIILIIQSIGKKYVIPFIPGIVLILVCVASPVNAYIRYMRPIMATMPLLTAYTIYLLYFRKRSDGR